MDEKLVDKEYLLEKLPGKYGWTYTIIPEIRPDPNAPFNWVKVRGTIDSYQIKGYRLMPSGDVMPSGKGEQTRVDRIAKTVTQLANRKKFADKE